MSRKRILLVAPWAGSSFIQQDLDILGRHFAVSKVELTVRSVPSLFVAILSRQVDCVFLWFAFWWSAFIVLVSKLVGVKTVFVPSGSDVARCPEINYGEMRFLRARILAGFALNNCDLVLPVSVFIKNEVLRYARPRRMKTVYNGVNLQKFNPRQSGPREDLAITVGSVSEMNIRYKRFDLFVESAKYSPEVKFALIGSHLDDSVKYLQSNAPSNVLFPGHVTLYELVEFYRRAKVYVQLSHAEAFGCALAESMACGCTPVVVDRGALSEIVGNTGFYAPYDEPMAIAHTIRNALNSDKRHELRERVSKLFSLEKREKELVGALNEVIGN
jgi:glycosyltransferase involved in cell wall biosynthesis